jgi:hypothetical protein
MDCTLDTEAIDALTNAFTSGMLQLTHLTWRGLCATPDHSHLLQAARQWLLAPPRSLVHLDHKIRLNGLAAPTDYLDDFKALVLAVAQRSRDGWPVKRADMWHMPPKVAAAVRRFASKNGVRDIVVVHGSKHA